MADFAPVITPSDLDGTNGFQISGGGATDRFGYSVASVGDFNGDGYDDFIVGAYHADANGADSGASYLVFGKATGFDADFDVSTLDGTNGFRLNGEAADQESGRAVRSAGDVNGDGFDDLVISSHGGPNGPKAGAAHVVFGKASGFSASLDLSALDGSDGFQISGEAADYVNHFIAASA